MDRVRLINFGQHTGLTAMPEGIYQDMKDLYYYIKDNCRSGLLKYMAETVSLLPKINAPKMGTTITNNLKLNSIIIHPLYIEHLVHLFCS